MTSGGPQNTHSVSLDLTNTPPRTDSPTGDSQTPATPTPGSPLDSFTFDQLFAKVFRYTERIQRPGSNRNDRYLDLENMSLTDLVYGVLPEDLVELYLGGYNFLLELDCALLPKTLEVLDVSRCKSLQRILNLDQLPNLMHLVLEGCEGLRSLPRVPPSLSLLNVSHCVNLQAIPALAKTQLYRLDMDWTMDVHTLPVLPDTLVTLNARFNYLDELPFLPDSLHLLDLAHGRVVAQGLAPERNDRETISAYTQRTRVWWNACLRKTRFDDIHEELMQKAWHPRRVEAWLLQGEHVLDNIMGCA